MRLAPGLIRIPDVSFFTWDRLRGRDLRKEQAIPDIVPNLAIEVLSSSNTAAEMSRKLAEYFAVGVEIVWYLDPAARTATIYRSVDASVIIREDELLNGGELLPGFSVKLAEVLNVAVPPDGSA